MEQKYIIYIILSFFLGLLLKSLCDTNKYNEHFFRSTQRAKPTSSATPTSSETSTDIFTKYSKEVGRDQDGQSIRKYENNTQKDCATDCINDPNCNGVVLYNDSQSTCWTVKGFPSTYSNSVSTIYRKNT